MEEKERILNIVALIIGILILDGGLNYLAKEKQDQESRKIYGIVSMIGGVIVAVFVIKTLIELL